MSEARRRKSGLKGGRTDTSEERDGSASGERRVPS